ncbi:hypothetical protein DAH55_03910 [Sphingomonas koreensis]|uniref:YdaS family helix-turn-helix protein n=1 Tax=Sphingomonas koreensis TaxID=93064 RepID=UPI00082E757B|nr:YdaS family helix-turn-helix protein [Sphingomonas koreensis]RSU63366.1 hypothetical protein DAH56_00365 [Sphingomonas koreensis]RSU71031.1 hypothetical protein DAH55_03910 [Sphingomonas koreensis]
MDTKPTRYEALKLVVEAYGSQEATAETFGVAQSTVSRWLTQSKQLPVEYVLQAEADTQISRHWLRPDIYPVEHSRPPVRFLGVDRAATRFHGNSSPDLDIGQRRGVARA